MDAPIIGPSGQTPLEPSASSTNVPLLSKQMQEKALELASQLRKILDDPSLSSQTSFLQEFSANAKGLNQVVEQAQLLR